MFDASKRNQANAGGIQGAQSLSADQRNKADPSGIQPIPADQRAIMAAVGASGPVGLTPSSLNTGLAAYWKMDETSGTRFDSVGTSNLTDNNTVGNDVGIIGNGASFIQANNEFLSCSSNASLALGDIDWTIALWFKFNSLTGNPAIMGKGFDAAYDFILLYSTAFAQLYFDVYDGGVNRIALFPSSFSFSAGVWNFIVFGHDSVNNLTFMQVNNGAYETTAESGPPLGDSGQDLNFSGYEHGTRNWLDGVIDEGGLFKRLLTNSEKTALYNGGAAITYI